MTTDQIDLTTAERLTALETVIARGGPMWYNISCLGEWVTGRFAFQAPSNHNLLLWAKRPPCVDSRPAARLDNDGKHMEGVLL